MAANDSAMGRGRDMKDQHRNSFMTDVSGATAVEFAMLFPLYVLLFLGMTSYGIFFGASHSIQQLAADAARVAIAGIDTTERRALAQAYITANADGYLFIESEKLTVAVGDNPVDPTQFHVALSYNAHDLPIWGLFDRLSMPDQVIVRRSTIRIGGI